MASVTHDGIFFEVGQGLFHWGQIRTGRARSTAFNYIYDCGTISYPRGLARCINECVREHVRNRGILDMLVISHLHLDHVSGLPQLLSRLRRVKKIIIPYVSPPERALCMEDTPKAFRTQEPDWFPEFLTKPVSYLLAHNVDEVVVVLGGDERITHREDTKSQEDGLREPQEPRAKHRKWAFTESSLSADHVYRREFIRALEKGEKSVGGDPRLTTLRDHRVRMVTASGAISSPLWTFRFFNTLPERTRLAEFQAQFRRLIGAEQLATLLRQRSTLRNLAHIYFVLFGRRQLNKTSLAMFSGVDQRGKTGSASLRWDSVPAELESDCIHRKDIVTNRRDWNPTGSVGLMFTGDLPVQLVLEAFVPRFRIGTLTETQPPTDFVIYQVPHHGSRHNWCEEPGSFPY